MTQFKQREIGEFNKKQGRWEPKGLLAFHLFILYFQAKIFFDKNSCYGIFLYMNFFFVLKNFFDINVIIFVNLFLSFIALDIIFKKNNE